jgi:hypothetical protein
MAHERDVREKSGKKSPARSLKQKRAAKEAKRNEKATAYDMDFSDQPSKSTKR